MHSPACAIPPSGAGFEQCGRDGVATQSASESQTVEHNTTGALGPGPGQHNGSPVWHVAASRAHCVTSPRPPSSEVPFEVEWQPTRITKARRLIS
jgi:hypothetical protein